MKKQKLFEKAKDLPIKPGCYLMKNSRGDVIYVGKAKSLKSRVSSYFSGAEKDKKTTILVGHISDFEFILVASDAESYVLENNLIKKHSPKYNIRLKDDKSYPYVYLDLGEKYPRIEYKRKFKRKSSMEIFGPFTTGSNVKEVVKLLRKLFYVRDCSNRQLKSRKRPCLLFQMDQCQGPCVSKVSEAEYSRHISKIVQFFCGRPEPTLMALEERMQNYAEIEEFEKAASIRDSIKRLEEFVSQSVQQNAEDLKGERSLDVIGFYKGDEEVELSFFIVRNGILLGSKNFSFRGLVSDSNLDEEIERYILQYYEKTNDSIPKRIVISFERNRRDIFGEALNLLLNERSPHKVRFSGSNGTFKSISGLVDQQAKEYQRVRLSHQESIYSGLKRLGELLGMSERPVVLECYDIAVWSGSSPTASQVVFHEGRPDRSAYRHFHMEEREEGNNDFEMMKEVLTRRMAHGVLPDAFIVDGGKGQINSFVSVLRDLGLDIPVAGIAKERTTSDFKSKEVEKSEERLVIPGRSNSYPLRKNPALFRILVEMRDEAHRFSRRLHHKAELKRIIPGI